MHARVILVWYLFHTRTFPTPLPVNNPCTDCPPQEILHTIGMPVHAMTPSRTPTIPPQCAKSANARLLYLGKDTRVFHATHRSFRRPCNALFTLPYIAAVVKMAHPPIKLHQSVRLSSRISKPLYVVNFTVRICPISSSFHFTHPPPTTRQLALNKY